MDPIAKRNLDKWLSGNYDEKTKNEIKNKFVQIDDENKFQNKDIYFFFNYYPTISSITKSQTHTSNWGFCFLSSSSLSKAM